MLDAEGPSHLDGVSFLNFRSDGLRSAAGIEWKDGYRFDTFLILANPAILFVSNFLFDKWKLFLGCVNSTTLETSRNQGRAFLAEQCTMSK